MSEMLEKPWEVGAGQDVERQKKDIIDTLKTMGEIPPSSIKNFLNSEVIESLMMVTESYGSLTGKERNDLIVCLGTLWDTLDILSSVPMDLSEDSEEIKQLRAVEKTLLSVAKDIHSSLAARRIERMREINKSLAKKANNGAATDGDDGGAGDNSAPMGVLDRLIAENNEGNLQPKELDDLIKENGGEIAASKIWKAGGKNWQQPSFFGDE